MAAIGNTILALLDSAADRQPEAAAILAPGRPPLGYGALSALIRRAIDALASAGIGRGSRVAIALPNGPEMAVALVAVMGCGECVPLDPARDEASYHAALRALRIEALIAPAGDDTPAARAARALGLPIIRLASAPEAPAGTFSLVADTTLQRPGPAAPPESDDVALVLQTSGTTAQPKIVPFTQRSLAAQALTRARHARHTHADRCLCVAPLHSGMAIRRCLLPVLATGGSIVCTTGFAASSFVAWLDELAPTFYVAVPAMHRAVLDEIARRGGKPRSTLRFVGSESVTLPAALERQLEEAFGVPVVQGYGLTETGLITQTPLPPRDRRAGSVGVPVDGEIATLEGGQLRYEPDRLGEIVVRGASVFSGYENDPEANLQAFHDGWFRTGDLGYVDQEGYLFVVGRLKEIINRGGTKVSPAAVDAALLEHPGVGDAATFPVPHPTLGEDVVTAVVLRDGAQVTPQALRDFAAARLPGPAVPSRVVPVTALPRSSRGKLQRADLARALAPQLQVEFRPPRDRHEELVARCFAEVLERDAVGASDDFFDLGGDSIHAALVVSRINAELGIDLEAVCLLRRSSVAEFAAEVASALQGQCRRANSVAPTEK